MIEKCDMCGSTIRLDACDCGTWTSAEENKNNPFVKGLEAFHDMKRLCITADAPHLGTACVFFRGDFNDCKKIQDFIYQMKNRPYYKDGL